MKYFIFLFKQFITITYKNLVEFINEHLVCLYLIAIILILFVTNIVIRDNKINELEDKVNILKFERDYILVVTEDSLNQNQ